jgi:hypothetical protein
MIERADYVHRLSDERDPGDRMRPFPPTHADVAIRIDTVWTHHFTLHKDTASSQRIVQVTRKLKAGQAELLRP